MAEKSGFFSSRGGDRTYTADFFADYFAQVLTNGIYNGGTNLQVTNSSDDMQSDIAEGRAFINGYFYYNNSNLSLTHSTADSSLNRIDRVILRLNTDENIRSISAAILEGTPDPTPTPPDLTRTDTLYEISLAQVLVTAGSSVIPVENITDERLDSSVCGLINSLIQVDTLQFQQEWEEWFEGQQTEGFLLGSNINQSGNLGVAGYDYVNSKIDGISSSTIPMINDIQDIKYKIEENDLFAFANQSGLGFFDTFKTEQNINTKTAVFLNNDYFADSVFSFGTEDQDIVFNSLIFDETVQDVCIKMYLETLKYLKVANSNTGTEIQVEGHYNLTTDDVLIINGEVVNITNVNTTYSEVIENKTQSFSFISYFKGAVSCNNFIISGTGTYKLQVTNIDTGTVSYILHNTSYDLSYPALVGSRIYCKNEASKTMLLYYDINTATWGTCASSTGESEELVHLNGKLYSRLDNATNKILIYNIATNSWDETSGVTSADAWSWPVVYNGKIYARYGSYQLASYDPDINGWTVYANNPSAGYIVYPTVYKDKIYCIMSDNTVYEFNLMTNVWNSTPLVTFTSDDYIFAHEGFIYSKDGDDCVKIEEVQHQVTLDKSVTVSEGDDILVSSQVKPKINNLDISFSKVDEDFKTIEYSLSNINDTNIDLQINGKSANLKGIALSVK